MANMGEILAIIKEFRNENHISPFRENEEFAGYAKEGIYDIDETCGVEINYQIDLQARSLLKNYMMYADSKRLAEFKELYGGEYIELQAKYYRDTDVQ